MQANEDVLQVVEVFKSASQKWEWILSHIVEFCSGKNWVNALDMNYRGKGGAE